MGSFLLARSDHDAAPRDVGPALKIFVDQGLPEPTKLSAGQWTLYALPYMAGDGKTAHVIETPDQDFAATFGTMLYGGQSGESALDDLYRDYRADVVDWQRLSGCYCVVLATKAGVTLFTDQGGSFKAYLNEDETVISSSLLATAAMTPRRTLDEQAAREYVFQGACYGWRTPIREVSMLRGARRYLLSNEIKEEPWPFSLPSAPLELSFNDHVSKCLNALDVVFDPIASAFGQNIDTALSGGYDSRLILALLRARGITPRLHVYGRDQDADVVVAKAIAAGEGLDLHHEDKSAAPMLPTDQLAETAARNYLLFDGLPNDGIFNNGRDFSSRLDRTGGGYATLNGGGGEIFRNFFYLPDQSMRVLDLVNSFYCQFDPHSCTKGFSEHDYLSQLGGKILLVLGRTSDSPLDAMLSRTEVELIYPLFRGQFWASRNTSVNNRIGPALTPFMEPALTRLSAEVPLRFKNNGRLEAALIKAIDPRLASYASAYGHAFDQPPPWSSRLGSALNRLRPTTLRRLSFRTRRRLGANADLSQLNAITAALLPDSYEPLGRLFRPSHISEAGQANRLATLAYFLSESDVSVSP